MNVKLILAVVKFSYLPSAQNFLSNIALNILYETPNQLNPFIIFHQCRG